MKTLTIGFIVFIGWSALSTYFYVCKIKGLCPIHENVLVGPVEVNKAFTADSLSKTLAPKPVEMPEILLIHFAFDESSFVSDSSMSDYYDKSMEYMFLNSGAGLTITGHTDAKGSDEYNLALGYRRALSVQDYFVNKGVPAEKIKIESKGEKEPAENNNTDKGRSDNRRAVITIKK
jgi:outer membrane protein OmpA-like peptidoglycan-associated protein